MATLEELKARVELEAADALASSFIARINAARTASELNRIAADAVDARRRGADLHLAQLRFYQRCRELYPDQVK